jgi:K+-sensing histidine kinase KdpD
MPTPNASSNGRAASPAAQGALVCGLRRNAARSAWPDHAADRDALQRNISLAESLGATVVRVTADRPADGLIAFAKREGITHVIFGQSARTRWRSCGKDRR